MADNEDRVWGPGVSSPPALTVDSDGKAHICCLYVKQESSKVKYVTNKSGSWQIFDVAEGGDFLFDSFCSIALDSNGKVHTAYQYCRGSEEPGTYCGAADDAMYVTNKSGFWQVEAVDDLLGGSQPSLALDSNGKAHVCYTVGAVDVVYGVRYATNSSGSWMKYTLEEDAHSCDIAVDLANKLRISYITSSDKVKYATNASGAWQKFFIDTIDTAVTIRNTSLALDSNNKVHISYHDFPDGGLKYATNLSGSWTVTIIDSGDRVGVYPSIAIDLSAYVHISYEDFIAPALKYATNRPPE